MNIPDQKARQQALDIANSFIVQAPAGSGKTELLIQRFLALLTTVNQPEEIIALTFTRKAAYEMRDRIIQALTKAMNEPQPQQAHQQKTWQLAKAVQLRNDEKNWNLQHYPNRLRIQTIDSLCMRLIQQAPLHTSYSNDIKISDDIDHHYQFAVRQLFIDIDAQHPNYPALAKLMLHLDNRQGYVESLLCQLLACRDQWLPYIIYAKEDKNLRLRLQQGLENIIKGSLEALCASIPKEYQQEIVNLVQFAGSQKNIVESQPAIAQCAQLQSLPTSAGSDLALWQGIATLFLTKSHSWRKCVDKRCGFPAASSTSSKPQQELYKAMKIRMQTLLAIFVDDETLRMCLQNVLNCPPAHYEEAQWEIVSSLMQILPLLAAQLNLVFNRFATIDYIEIMTRALYSLSDEDSPSELALILDYKIKHLLVDEFQDTSIRQFQLLEKLTAGWQIGDGRTLFVVGDPMQSIYSFRGAEVGLFLWARDRGIGDVPLQSLQLTANFRSQATIVEWNNLIFGQIFPQKEDINQGAIRFNSAQAQQVDNHLAAINYYACEDEQDEAQQIITLIKKIHTQDKKTSIAILVKARSHLSALLPELHAASMPYQAQCPSVVTFEP
ncbi:MAG: UvrD-helicase domain-containing protein [Gammaproteobacteria bacterium]